MAEKCCGSMQHYEHMCSLTLNGCAAETAYAARTESFQCSPCDDKSHRHNEICTPNIVGA